MENKEHLQPEEEQILPENTPSIQPDPPDALPVIQELTFADTPDEQALSLPEEPLPEDSLPPKPPLENIAIPEEAPSLPTVQEPEPFMDGAAFMERIPDTAEDYPPESALAEPVMPQEIQHDTQAMDAHGMLEHGQPEPDFDMSILNDPELALPEEKPVVEEVADHEYRDNSKEFDTMFHAPKPKKQEPELPRQIQKGRPKRKKGEGLLGIPNILVTLVWLALIVIIGVTGGRMLWICAADVLAFGREDKSVTITIYEADTMDDIVDKLHDNGLIRYKSLFNLYASISHAEEDIKPGIYDLNTRYDYHALVNFMSPRSSREVITLTIPEGYSCKQIFSLLEENRICTAVDIAAYASEGELEGYWFLEGVARGTDNCLEGYLFPDTYEFYKNSTPKEALSRMLNNFEIKFSDEMRTQLDALNATLTGNYTVREIVTVASLIEKESAAPAESPKVAGVIYNRLFNWGANPAYLNIDASIVYAQGGESDTIDTKLDSPYNTYTNVGLTPTPIANPGLSSLKAALNPETHNFYYYVLNPSTGMHQFSTTQAEHNAYIAQFYH